jgi:hypothetical protein
VGEEGVVSGSGDGTGSLGSLDGFVLGLFAGGGLVGGSLGSLDCFTGLACFGVGVETSLGFFDEVAVSLACAFWMEQVPSVA